MNIETAGINDIEELTELRIAYLQEDHGSLSENEKDGIRKRLGKYYPDHLNRDLYAFVLREEGRIVSCAFLLVQEKPASPSFPNGLTGTVLNVYTMPSKRRKGYGRRIMHALTEKAKELELSVIELKATDQGYSLYRALGFADSGHEYHSMKWRNEEQF